MAAKRQDPMHFSGATLTAVKLSRSSAGAVIRKPLVTGARQLRVQPESVSGYPHLIRASIHLSKGATSVLLGETDSIEIFDSGSGSLSSLTLDAESGLLRESSSIAVEQESKE